MITTAAGSMRPRACIVARCFAALIGVAMMKGELINADGKSLVSQR